MSRLAAIAAAAGLTASLGLSGGFVPAGIAATGVGAWGVLAVSAFGPIGVLATLPAGFALLLDGTLLGLVGWTIAGAAGACALQFAAREYQHAGSRDLRHRIRQGEHDHRVLVDSVGRYPALQEASLALSAVRDVDHLAEVLCHQVLAVVPGATAVQVHLGVAAELVCRANIRRSGSSAGHESVPGDQAPGDDEKYVAIEARSLIRRAHDGVRVLLPLRGERRGNHGREALCGVVVALLPKVAAEEHLHLELLRALAQLGGIGLAAVELVSQARGLALRDDLTGLFGQHEFLRRLDEQVATARRHVHPLGVIMCDLDHLKRFNDAWGHAAGDVALQAVAQAIRALVTILPGAIACRYGGEEFALCLPGHADAKLHAIADRLRRDIAEAIPDPFEPQRRVTASLGIASLRPGENGRALLIRADAAAYRAKAAGRNIVSSADDLGSVEAATRILPVVTGGRFTVENAVPRASQVHA